MRAKELQELRRLHKQVIHTPTEIEEADWYRLARLETKKIDRLSLKELQDLEVCKKCF